MSPPEIWGPAVWTLFHVLAERINEQAYSYLFPSMFMMIKRICKFLPCPECSNDATKFLAKLKITDMKTKLEFKNTIYLFHNYVNAKKRKRLFNYGNINIYKNYKIVDVVNRFLKVYNTKGNMNLLTESFQRQFVINDFKKWISTNIKAFVNMPIPNNVVKNDKIVEEVENDKIVEELNDKFVDKIVEEIENVEVENVEVENVEEENVEEENVEEENVEEENVEVKVENQINPEIIPELSVKKESKKPKKRK